MHIKKILRFFGWAIIFLLIIVLVSLPFTVFPVISGYGAKIMCSAVFLQHRSADDVLQEDLFFPVNLGSFRVDLSDSSVTGSVLGLSKRKAIFRKGLGATLVNDLTEAEIRRQRIVPAIPSLLPADSIPWPVGNKTDPTLPQTVSKALLDSAIQHVLHQTKKDGSSALTKAVVIIYDGKLIAEGYAPGFDQHTLLLGWSMAKSITSAIAGVMVNKGLLDIQSRAPVAAWANTPKEEITVKQLLQQSSGIDFSEVYFRPSDANTMLWSSGDMAAYSVKQPLAHSPGTAFNYSGGNANILSRIFRDKLGEVEYYQFPYRELFHKINAPSFLLETDASGTFVGSSFVYATARDYARFGLLYYNMGKWNGEQVLSEQWVKETATPADAAKRRHYGYMFWLNGLSRDGKGRWYPDAPDDMYFADGFGGQNIFIIPSEKLVLVRMGLREFDDDRFIKEVIDAVRGK